MNEGSVTVTNARFVVPGQTYALSGITSVSTWVKKPSKKGPIISIIIGLIALFIGIDTKSAGGIGFGVVLIGIGALILFLQKPTYTVRLYTASGEVDAISSKDRDFIHRISGAVTDAIVARG